MDSVEHSVDLLSMAMIILMLLLNTHKSLELNMYDGNDKDTEDVMAIFWDGFDRATMTDDTVSRAVLHHFRLWNSLLVFDEELGFWVKLQSTTWFSKFLLEEYDDDRWVQMFRMMKHALLSLAELLAPLIQRRDTNYCKAIPVTVRVACTLFKLSHGTSLLICNELFAVGHSTISILLQDVVHAVNVGLRNEIMWPRGEDIQDIATGFQQLCGLPGVVRAIDGTHFAIAKPQYGASDYFYFKSSGYSMTCQAVVDSSKRFLDLNVGMLGSTNDSRVLRRSTLFHRGQRGTLWDAGLSFNGFSPYVIGDGGYPLLPWLMVLHQQFGNLSFVATSFNRRLSHGKSVVENAFALLKQSSESFIKSPSSM